MTKLAQKLIKSAAAIALGASTVTTVVATSNTSASAKTTYKVSHGKLINAKSKKAIAGFKTFDSVLYKNGKKFTGIYKGKYYKEGTLYTGVVYKTYFKKDVKLTGTFKGIYYKYGKPFTGEKGHVLFKNGKKLNRVTVKGIYYINGVRANGIYEIEGENVEFQNGKVVADRVAPVITLEDGAKTIYNVKNGEVFTAPKATAKDNLDKTINVNTKIFNSLGKEIDNIDTTVAGTYKIKYYAEDLASNKAKVTITVVVAPAEQVAPTEPVVTETK